VEADPEYDSMRLRFLDQRGVVFFRSCSFSMLGDLIGGPSGAQVRNGLEFFLARPVVLWAAGHFRALLVLARQSPARTCLR